MARLHRIEEMKTLKLILGLLVMLAGVGVYFGNRAKPVGPPVPYWENVQQHFGAALMLLIGASLVISARKQGDE